MAEKSSQSDLSATKLLESGKSTRKLLQKLNSPRLSSREMADLLSLIARESSCLKSWTHALTQISFHGARAFAKANPTAANDCGLDSLTLSQLDDSAKEPWLIPKLKAKFVDDARVQYNMTINSLDNLSRLGALTFDSDQDSEKWDVINPLCWTAWGRRGSIGVIRGKIKSGKTNLSLLLSQLFMAKGYTVVSNISVVDAPKEYVYASTLSAMLIATCEARLQNKEVFLIMDEAALFWNKIQTVMKANIDLSKLLMAIGKLHIILCFIVHEEQQTPGVISRMHCASWEKKDLTSVYVEISDGPLRLRPRLLTHAPPTTLSYDPDALTYWSINMSVNELFDFMSNIPQGSNQWELVLDYVKKHGGETSEESLSPREVAVYLRKRGLSEGAIAKALNKSGGTIHLWVSEVEKGEEKSSTK
ncbi:MAG TPA: hypothetical protein VGB78_09745 [Thermoplasmata archaeon]